jgi:threonine aldolase
MGANFRSDNEATVAQTTPSIGAVICHEHSHLHTDECAASEFYSGGAKLLALPGKEGKLGAESVREKKLPVPAS